MRHITKKEIARIADIMIFRIKKLNAERKWGNYAK